MRARQQNQASTMQTQPKLIDIFEAARISGLSEEQIRNALKKHAFGFPRPFKLGRAIRWIPDEIIEWRANLQRA